MGFQDAVKTCISKYIDFSGRAPRSEYWWFVLFIVIGSIVFGFLDGLLFGGGPESIGIFGPIFSLATIIPTLAVGARRLHDIDRTGWWLLVGLIPIIGTIILLVFFIQKGTEGPNRFGPDPLAGGDQDAA